LVRVSDSFSLMDTAWYRLVLIDETLMGLMQFDELIDNRDRTSQ
jgi:hypothetical protein